MESDELAVLNMSDCSGEDEYEERPMVDEESPEKSEELLDEEAEKAKNCKKTILDGTDDIHLFPLPEGWQAIRHESGMIVYCHKYTKTVTASRPYFCDGPIRTHSIPAYAIPCLYRQMMEEKKTRNPPEASKASEASEARPREKSDNSETSEITECPMEKTEEPPVVEKLTTEDFRNYCEKRFKFKEIRVNCYPNAKYMSDAHQARKAESMLKQAGFEMSYEEIKKKNDDNLLAAPSGAVLIDLTPIETSKKAGPRKPYLLNPMGKTTVAVLNEFVQRLVKGQLTYILDNALDASPQFKVTAMLTMKKSVLEEMKGQSREILMVLCEIAQASEDRKEMETTEDSVTFAIGEGVSWSKKSARLVAARDAICKLVPKLRVSEDNVCEGISEEGVERNFEKESREFFEKIPIDSRNLLDLCCQSGVTKPFILLKIAISRSSRWKGLELRESESLLPVGKNLCRVALTLGELEAEATMVGTPHTINYAAQLLFQKMHPEFKMYGSFLEVYEKLEEEAKAKVKERKKKKQEEDRFLAQLPRKCKSEKRKIKLARLKVDKEKQCEIQYPHPEPIYHEEAYQDHYQNPPALQDQNFAVQDQPDVQHVYKIDSLESTVVLRIWDHPPIHQKCNDQDFQHCQDHPQSRPDDHTHEGHSSSRSHDYHHEDRTSAHSGHSSARQDHPPIHSDHSPRKPDDYHKRHDYSPAHSGHSSSPHDYSQSRSEHLSRRQDHFSGRPDDYQKRHDHPRSPPEHRSSRQDHPPSHRDHSPHSRRREHLSPAAKRSRAEDSSPASGGRHSSSSSHHHHRD